MTDVKTSRVMLDELRHSFDTAYISVKKYTTKTFAVFGAEITMLLFYMSDEEMRQLRSLFNNTSSGWYIFALFAFTALIISATLFILTLATDRRWEFPPNEEILLSRNQYEKMNEREIIGELVLEYNKCIDKCVKKVHRMKVLSDIGTYFMIGGVACLLIIKIFGI